MSDNIDRAAEALAATKEFNQMIDFGSIGDEVKIARQLVEAFDAAGLLVTPERDAEVAAGALREAADVLEGGMTAHDPDLIAFGRRSAIAALRDRADRIERRLTGDA